MMGDMRSEEIAQASWQGYRPPLPMPARLPHGYPYAQASPSSVALPYHASARSSYQPVHPHSHHQLQSPPLESHASQKPALNPTHHSYSSLKRPYENYEEPSYSEPQHEVYEGAQEPESAVKPSIQPDHRLLSFSTLAQRQSQTILDQYGRPTAIDVAAQIHGMFFLSEIATNAGDNIVIQPELTCYRRNLFQISGSVTSPSGPLSVYTDRGETVPIVALNIDISAMESVDGHVIRLIVIPWKTPPPNVAEVPPNAEQDPPAISLLCQGSTNERNGELLVQPIAWRRLQFRVATANNGRRKELQQHFLLKLKVTATLADGTRVCVSESATAPIVVRGRSPRNFQARNQIPLVGSSASPRGAGPLQTSPAERKVKAGLEKDRQPKPEGLQMPKAQFQFDGSSFPPSPVLIRNSYSQWSGPTQHSDQHTAATTPTYPPPQMTASSYMNHGESTDLPRLTTSSVIPTQPPVVTAPPRGQYYHTNSSSPASALPLHFVDSNPRPAKSPRHAAPPDLSSINPYPPFRDSVPPQYAVPDNEHTVPPRDYFPGNGLPSEAWQPTENGNVSYSAPMHAPSNQQYGFNAGSYAKEPPQHPHYTWSST